MNKVLCFFMVIPYLLIAQNNNSEVVNDGVLEKKLCNTTEVNSKKEEVCNTGSSSKESNIFYLEEGNYKGLWNSKATNGAEFKDLKVTATIIKKSDTEYTGALYISDNLKSCCKTKGDSGDGPISIIITGKDIKFNWVDNISSCLGEFKGKGVYTENNKIILTSLTGKDCDGDHNGSITFFKE